MKKGIRFAVGIALVVGVALGFLGGRLSSAEPPPNPLTMGKVLAQTDLVGCKGMEAMLVERLVPPGGEAGRHTQAGNEIGYLQSGSAIVEIQGKAPMTLKAGEAFTTSAGQVHNVKNASTTEGAKAIVFYVAKKGTKMEDLSVPVH